MTRSGTEEDFTRMVHTCNNHGIRIINDVVLNHMARGDSGVGVAGTMYNGTALDYPGVPYNKTHFHSRDDCTNPDAPLSNLSSTEDLRQCQLLELPDLDQSQDYVRDQIVGLLNKLIDHGSAGFRVDAAKHIHPQQLSTIYSTVKNVVTGGRPVFINEVVNTIPDAVTSDQYYNLGLVTEFVYSEVIGEKLSRQNYSGLCDSFKDLLHEENALLFVDNHDTQRGRERPGSVVLNYKNPSLYKRAQALTLAAGYGTQRVMSSYYFTDTEAGPPADDNENILDVSINTESLCDNGWVCEHRWPVIKNSVQFSNFVRGKPMANCSATENTVSFSRGSGGFFWMSSNNSLTSQIIYSELPEGYYCDVITDCQQKYYVNSSGILNLTFFGEPIVALVKDNFTEEVTTDGSVLLTDEWTTESYNTSTPEFTYENSNLFTNGDTHPATDEWSTDGYTHSTTDEWSTDGYTHLTTDEWSTDGYTHSTTDEWSTDGYTHPTTDELSTTTEPQTILGWHRTVVFLERRTNPGEDVFFRGGITSSRISDPKACETYDFETNPCVIPIRHRQLQVLEATPARDSWAKGDNFLDWFGPEPTQEKHGATLAQGSPGQWTSSVRGSKYYDPLNTYGDHYWILDVDMDCSRSYNGFFEFKGVLSNGWETGTSLDINCSGDAAVTSPYHAGNHIGRCGYINVYHWGSGTCEIHSFLNTTSS
ncbi:alpha-amylase-like isoform X2 [Physella acuta]|nr:alpha-amylase-like isoform X2 [Physella acuta]XP_059155812.1 alpha-amylase-like isoform X2 [Physella acuta]XP_059155813.1 alpha-amylase-like isoform X2 [Physella acuta]